MLYTAPRVLPTKLHTAAGLDNKKKWGSLYIKNKTYFLYSSSLLQMWSLRKRVEEIMSVYVELTGDLFTSTISLDSPWHLNMAAFTNTSTRHWQGWQLTSSQATCSTMWVGCQSRWFLCLFWRETRQRILGHEISPYPEVVRGRKWELTTRPSREAVGGWRAERGSWRLESRGQLRLDSREARQHGIGSSDSESRWVWFQ